MPTPIERAKAMGNLMGTAAIASMSPAGLAHPSQLEYMRVTSLKVFEQCPYTWAHRFLAPGGMEDGEKSGYAAIGTAVHAICEDMLMQLHAGALPADTTNHWTVVPDDEAPAVIRYMEKLAEIPGRPIVVEERLFHQMRIDAPPISGQIDVAYETPEGDLLIVDHKTHRQYQPASFWSTQLQQLCYAWMARREWPGYRKYLFRIGYPNLGTHVQWETDPSDDEALAARFDDIWMRMILYADHGQWPRTVNDECGYCPLKEACPERMEAATTFSSSVVSKLTGRSTAEKLLHVKTIQKVVEDVRKELEEALAKEVRASKGTLVSGGMVWTLERTAQRKAAFMPTIEALNRFTADNPDSAEAIRRLADDIFTVKVGGLDKAVTAVPALKGIVSSVAPKVYSKEEALKSAPAGKAVKA